MGTEKHLSNKMYRFSKRNHYFSHPSTTTNFWLVSTTQEPVACFGFVNGFPQENDAKPRTLQHIAAPEPQH